MEQTKTCPYCGETILAVAKKCRYCGEWLTETPTSEVKEKVPQTPKIQTTTSLTEVSQNKETKAETPQNNGTPYDADDSGKTAIKWILIIILAIVILVVGFLTVDSPARWWVRGGIILLLPLLKKLDK